ncbi:MAG: hypothetical protein H8D45_01800, partial [Bacteroidetes bacterium]|nr:hypothetical protein [Bacteroidota bacterium]
MKINHKPSTESVRLQILREILTTGEESVLSVGHSNAIIAAGVTAFDDCAIVDINNTTSLVIGMDFIRGTGFDMFELGIMDYYDVGYYLIIANLSDVASMGAQPIGITTVVRYPKDMTDNQFRDIFRGMKDASDKYNVPIIGGDTGGYQLTVVAATAFGITDKGKYLLRSGVQQGDILCVTGNIGIPVTALAYFKHAHNHGFTLTS